MIVLGLKYIAPPANPSGFFVENHLGVESSLTDLILFLSSLQGIRHSQLILCPNQVTIRSSRTHSCPTYFFAGRDEAKRVGRATVSSGSAAFPRASSATKL